MSESSLTAQLTNLIHQIPIGQHDQEVAALFMLDAVANSVAGRNSEAGKIILQWVKSRLSDQGRCAFALGALTHIVEMDDLHRTSVTHPGCVIIPAVMACALEQGATGHQILKAVLNGFEACTRIGNAVGTEHYKVWHNTATCGPYGSAMALSVLLGLDHAQTVNALGNAGTQSSGFWQFLETGAMSKHLHAGRAAESGMLAAQLASQGFSGPAHILEGEKGMFAGMCKNPNPKAITASPEQGWQLLQTSIKPWPCCRHTHPVIDAALELSNKIDIKEVESISIKTYPAALNVCDRPIPDSLYEAKFSLHHCVAAALSDGKVEFDSFDSQSRQRLAHIRQRVKVSVAEPFESAYPQSWGAGVFVTMKNSEEISVQRDKCKGDPDLPLSRDEMIDKARMLMEFGDMESKPAESLISNILSLVDDRPLSKNLIQSVLM